MTFKPAALIAFIWLTGVPFPGAASLQAADTMQDAEHLELIYRVIADGRALGSIEVTLSRDESMHRVEAITRPEGIARLFASQVTEEFSYRPNASGWQPGDYRETDGKEEPTVFRFENGGQLVAHGVGETTRHPADSLVEPQGFPLAAFLIPTEQLDRTEILMPTNRGIRSYSYRFAGEERLTMDDLTVDTWKWLKQQPGRRERGFIIWTDKESRIPIRIEKFKKNGSMIVELLPSALHATN